MNQSVKWNVIIWFWTLFSWVESSDPRFFVHADWFQTREKFPGWFCVGPNIIKQQIGTYFGRLKQIVPYLKTKKHFEQITACLWRHLLYHCHCFRGVNNGVWVSMRELSRVVHSRWQNETMWGTGWRLSTSQAIQEKKIAQEVNV